MGSVAVAVIRSDPPQIFIADDEATLSRVLALQVVSQSDPSILAEAGVLEEVRSALLQERWGDAVASWMEATSEEVDAYPDETVWQGGNLDAEATSLEIRLARVFTD